MRINVESNIDAVTRQLLVRDPVLLRRATVSGLNKGMTAAGKIAIKGAAAAVGIAQKWIRQRTKRTRASQRRLTAITSFAPRGLNPLSIGMSVEQADAYYRGPRVANTRAFTMRVSSGSLQVVVRRPSSTTSTPASGPDRRRWRLPVQSIRIFIGKETIRRFNEALKNEGVEAFEKAFRDYIRARS